jgi:DNA topoisomerase-2
MRLTDVEVVKGLYKIFDEACVNARDHYVRMTSAQGATKVDDQPVRNIEVTIDRESGVVTVRNDGNGIDVVEHPEHKVQVPELIFGHLRTSTNYDDSESKTTGGRNGYGVKLAFIWAKWGSVETVDHKRKKKYTQRFENNLADIRKATITRSTVKPYTEVSFLPDYERFGLPGLTDDMYDVLVKRVYDLGAVTDTSVKIKLDGQVLPVRTFAACVDLYRGPKGEDPRVVEESECGRWRYAAAKSQTDEFDHLSFVNGINTSNGGTHVQYLLNQITRKLTAYIQAKKGVKVKTTAIKEQLWLMVDSVIENPSFDSQTKDVLKTPSTKFGSSPTVSDKFIEKLAKMGIMETALSLTAVKDKETAKKTDGKKSRSVRGIAKLTDANYAGGAKSGVCTLILCEGDSAKAGVLSGLSRDDRNCFGVYALKGKPLNVRDVTPKRISENNECTEIKQAMGLTTGASFATAGEVAKNLRYGKICIMADQDLDGCHIKGLVVNYIETQWPSLAAIDGFIGYMSTPIVKAKKGATEIQFYNEAEKIAWEESQGAGAKGWKLKYYKGLGTSSGKEWREYFADPHLTGFNMSNDCKQTLYMAFAKACANERKTWLGEHDATASLDATLTSVTYKEWTDKELRPFSVYDCERSVPGVDGLKPSQRKVLYAARKRNMTGEVKVAQFAGYVSEHSAYHHGEASLNKTIVGMAQEFPGSNNIAILQPSGQFGTRLEGGKDSASERYIYTLMAPITEALFPPGDDAVLPRVLDDGHAVEPEFYTPVMPVSLVNGVCGIGTGFSSSVPSCNPITIATYIRASLNGTTQPTIAPYFQDFKGDIALKPDGKYVTKGVWRRVSKTTIHVSELPVGVWTQDFKTRLEKLLADKQHPSVKDYADMSTDQVIDFTIDFYPGVLDKGDLTTYVDKTLNMVSNKSMNNMHIFDRHKRIQKFAELKDVLDAYIPFRLEFCGKRIEHEIAALTHQIQTIQNKCRFIAEQISGVLDLRGKNSAAAIALLEERGYHVGDKSAPFQYMLRMSFTSLLQENIDKMTADCKVKESEMDALQKMTPEQLWIGQLDTFGAAYCKYLKDRGSRNNTKSK